MIPPRAPLFPPWADTVLRVAFAVLVGSVIAGPLLAMVWVRSAYSTGQGNPVRQPIAFDHRHHVRDVGADCRFCHASVDKSKSAGIPPTELCMGCHGQIWNDAGVLQALRDSAANKTPIQWTRVNSLPDHVQFHHGIHVSRGVGCETCHGRVDTMGQVYQAKPLTMHWCIDCHRDPTPHLRPLDQVTAMGVKPDRVRGEKIAASFGGVHPPADYCTGCHR